jgi:ATP citrate (pro-S)-lyase
MAELIESDYGVGDVIALLWFKRKLPKYATKFIEM